MSMKDAMERAAASDPKFQSVLDEAKKNAAETERRMIREFERKAKIAEEKKRRLEEEKQRQIEQHKEEMRVANRKRSIWQYTFHPDTWAVEVGICFADSEEEARSIARIAMDKFINHDKKDFKLKVVELDCSEIYIPIFSHWE